MANIMMTPMAASPKAAAPEPPNRIGANETHFSKYMSEKNRTEQSRKRSMLGVGRQQRDAIRARRQADREQAAGETDSAAMSVEEYLRQLMARLQGLLDQDGGPAAGWKVATPGDAWLDKLGAAAGLAPEELGALRQRLEQGDDLTLGTLFSFFEQHFADMAQPGPVSAPETDLPLLESFLDRMGVDPATLSHLADSSVDGMGNFDLNKYLQGLGQLADKDLSAASLSDWDLDQLRAMLEDAGADRKTIAALFPERPLETMPGGDAAAGVATRDDTALPDVRLGLQRLREVLASAIDAAEAARPKADPARFIGHLEEILGQAESMRGGADLNPVLQKTVGDLFAEVQKMLSNARVRIERVQEIMARDESLAEAWLASGSDKNDKALAAALKTLGPAGSGKEAPSPLMSANEEQGRKGGAAFSAAHGAVPAPTPSSSGAEVTALQRHTAPQPRFALHFNQYTVSQLSQAVTRGLRAQEHHLVMTLYPKELGEVKVDMHVRDNQVSVAFVMENPKVKQALESNMQQFQDNLERQGYFLGGLAVSVDQNNDGGRQGEFESSWREMRAQGAGRRGTAPLPEPQWPAAPAMETLAHDGGVSLFV